MLHKGGFLCAYDSLTSCDRVGMKGDSMDFVLVGRQDHSFAAQGSSLIQGNACKVSELAQGYCSYSPAFWMKSLWVHKEQPIGTACMQAVH